MKDWYVYIVKCSDESLYTGITVDVNRRIEEHNNSTKGAKYTRSKRPVHLVYSETQADRSSASKRESAIKKLSRKDKLLLILKYK
jgi:putative endonuclease